LKYLKENRLEIDAYANKFSQFDEFGVNLIHNGHCMSESIREKLNDAAQLKENLEKVDQFERDCDELKTWMNEKRKETQSKEYLDLINLNSNEKNHFNLENEVLERQPYIEKLCRHGQSLCSKEQTSYHDKIQNNLTQIKQEWNLLLCDTQNKSKFFEQAKLFVSFKHRLEEIELWLIQAEKDYVNMGNISKNAVDVQILLKKLNEFQSDLNSRKDAIDNFKRVASNVQQEINFDALNLSTKQALLAANLNNFHEKINKHKEELLINDNSETFQFIMIIFERFISFINKRLSYLTNDSLSLNEINVI
jgi:hypothetical protein